MPRGNLSLERKLDAITALPHPAKTSQKVPSASAPRRCFIA